MPVKFKIGFMIDAETLFGIVAKFLPLENLTVEEMVERDAPPGQPRLPKIAAMVAKAKPTRARPGIRKTINLDEGVNAVIMHMLADGEAHRFHELTQAMKAAGYSSTGLGSRLVRLLEHGFVIRLKPGEYRLGKKDAA